jgi:VIT1/CCC1 family predicted Fe2+/Mn2+ transporter
MIISKSTSRLIPFETVENWLERKKLSPSIPQLARKIPRRTKTMQIHSPPPRPPLEHLGKHRQYWRDIILGVNDGLVSTFLLVAGVVGGSFAPKEILLTAISGALAGAVSMSAGEYIATKSQNEVLQGEIALEREHIRHHTASEMEELNQLLGVIGIPAEMNELHKVLFDYYHNDHEALLKLMVVLEFGFVEEEVRSPILAALVSGSLFFTGSLPSLLPFAIGQTSTTISLYIAAVLVICSLLLVGTIKTWATRGNCLSAAIENLVVAGVGGLIAYYVGALFSNILG